MARSVYPSTSVGGQSHTQGAVMEIQSSKSPSHGK